MSKQFFYVQLKFTPKNDTRKEPITQNHEVVVEVPKDLLTSEYKESTIENPGEEIIVLGLARAAALGTFPTIGEPVAAFYDEGAPLWYDERPDIMNQRPCDHEYNGTRAWRIV